MSFFYEFIFGNLTWHLKKETLCIIGTLKIFDYKILKLCCRKFFRLRAVNAFLVYPMFDIQHFLNYGTSWTIKYIGCSLKNSVRLIKISSFGLLSCRATRECRRVRVVCEYTISQKRSKLEECNLVYDPYIKSVYLNQLLNQMPVQGTSNNLITFSIISSELWLFGHK